jgi:hypothetical protein
LSNPSQTGVNEAALVTAVASRSINA